MRERDFHGAEAAHRHTDYCAVHAARSDWKTILNVHDQVFYDIIFVAIVRFGRGVHPVRFIAFGHDEDQSLLGVFPDVGVVSPIPKAAATSVKKVDGWSSLV